MIREFSAEPATIEAEPGRYATLRWEVSNAYSLTIEPGDRRRRNARHAPRVAGRDDDLHVDGDGPDGATTRTVTVTVAGTTAAAGAPQSSAPRAAAIPRLADGKPDLSGVYARTATCGSSASVQLAPGAESFRVVEADGARRRHRRRLPAARRARRDDAAVPVPDRAHAGHARDPVRGVSPVQDRADRPRARRVLGAGLDGPLGRALGRRHARRRRARLQRSNRRSPDTGTRKSCASSSATREPPTTRSHTRPPSRIPTCSPNRCAIPAR